MSVTYTRQDCITQAIANLRKLGNDPTPQPEDNDKVDGVFDACVARLSAREVYTISDPGTLGPADGAIEAEAFQDFAVCLAWAAALRFNMAGNPVLAAANAEAEDSLRVIAAPPRTLRVLKIEKTIQPLRRYGIYNGSA